MIFESLPPDFQYLCASCTSGPPAYSVFVSRLGKKSQKLKSCDAWDFLASQHEMPF